MSDRNKTESDYNFWAEQTNEEKLIKCRNTDDCINNKTKNNFMKISSFLVIAIISFVIFQSYLCKDNICLKDLEELRLYNEYSKSDKLHVDNPATSDKRILYTKSSNIEKVKQSKITNIINKTMPSIVSIEASILNSSQWFGEEFEERDMQSGTGIIIGKSDEDLLIATNNHVVGNSNKIKITFIDGKEANAILKGVDVVADLAVIIVNIKDIDADTINSIKVAEIGDSTNVKVGEMSIAIGNALGYGQSVTVGYISAKDRKVSVNSAIGSRKMLLLQTDAAINPGNSGGALLNIEGQVIGINTIKFASSRVEGMGYAIPITRALPIINELTTREELPDDERGFLGIKGSDILEEDILNYGMPYGVYVVEVTQGGGAELAGILPGDIIVGINDIEIT
ncbi:MAG TPA: serine protease, partial [Clostridiales bacterium]|nr:serine protease [Clostridiales bacterium]